MDEQVKVKCVIKKPSNEGSELFTVSFVGSEGCKSADITLREVSPGIAGQFEEGNDYSISFAPAN